MSDAAKGDDARSRDLPPGPPDPRGEAALVLVESLIHELVAQAALPMAAAIEVVRTAIDAQVAISDERGQSPGIEPQAVRFLSAIADTLSIGEGTADGNGPAPQPPHDGRLR